jgi:shikimate dehydrogenase
MSRHPGVDGATQLLGIVGHPIAQVRAPEVWTALFREHGINMLCIPFHVPPEDLATFYAGARTMKNLVGMIVTIPHKLVTAGLVDEFTERAQIVRSVNFIAVGNDGRWIGDVTDGVGFVENLKTNGTDPKGKRALLIGTGGVGTAIAFALADGGVSDLVVYDKDAARSSNLVARLAETGRPVRVGTPDPAGFELVVNASPVGMRADDPLPVDAGRLVPGAIVADVIVHETELLRRAAALGCRTIDGTGMMDHQLATMAAHLGLGDRDFSVSAAKRVVSKARG